MLIWNINYFFKVRIVEKCSYLQNFLSHLKKLSLISQHSFLQIISLVNKTTFF